MVAKVVDFLPHEVLKVSKGNATSKSKNAKLNATLSWFNNSFIGIP